MPAWQNDGDADQKMAEVVHTETPFEGFGLMGSILQILFPFNDERRGITVWYTVPS